MATNIRSIQSQFRPVSTQTDSLSQAWSQLSKSLETLSRLNPRNVDSFEASSRRRGPVLDPKPPVGSFRNPDIGTFGNGPLTGPKPPVFQNPDVGTFGNGPLTGPKPPEQNPNAGPLTGPKPPEQNPNAGPLTGPKPPEQNPNAGPLTGPKPPERNPNAGPLTGPKPPVAGTPSNDFQTELNQLLSQLSDLLGSLK